MVHDNRLLLEDCLDDTPQVKYFIHLIRLNWIK
jgi:hypothetical protein